MYDPQPRSPPTDETELLARAQAIAGLTLRELAEREHVHTPKSFRRAKGFAGQLIELALGANAGSSPLPDFPHLGVELKTIPIADGLKPLESTHICVASVDSSGGALGRERGDQAPRAGDAARRLVSNEDAPEDSRHDASRVVGGRV